MKQRISYTIWGKVKDSNNWIEWYNDVDEPPASNTYARHIGRKSTADE